MATTESSAEILVVGAGPTGLVMAAELARRGVSCRVVDQASGPSVRSKAIGIQARTLEAFENMGIVQEFTEAGHPIRRMRIFSEKQEIGQLSFAGLESAYPYILMLPQSETERILNAHLERQGLQVEREVTFTGFTRQTEGAQATLKH